MHKIDLVKCLEQLQRQDRSIPATSALMESVIEALRDQKELLKDISYLGQQVICDEACNVCRYNPNSKGCELEGSQFNDDGECHFEWRGRR